MDKVIERSSLRLKKHLFGERYDLGFVGVGVDKLFVYVHGTRRQWSGKSMNVWEDYRVCWRYNIGFTTAQATP